MRISFFEMADLSKFGNIHKIDSSIDEFDVIRTNYVANISFKSFEIPSVPLTFNLPSVDWARNPNVLRALDIPLQTDSITFIFQLEGDETFAGQGWKIYKLFMKVAGESSKVQPTYADVLVLTECPCLEPSTSCDNGQLTLMELTSSPLEIFTHKHDCSIQQLPGIITVKFTLIDISRATLTPLGILKLMGKRNCIDALEPFANDWENKPHDIVIVCEDDYRLVAHKMILKARSPLLRSILEVFPETTELNARVSSSFAMKVILHYIYSGTLQEDWMKDVDGVISAAKHYQLLELIELFEHLLVNACNANSAFTIYLLARKHSLVHASRSIQNKYLFIQRLSVDVTPESSYENSSTFEICYELNSVDCAKANKNKTL